VAALPLLKVLWGARKWLAEAECVKLKSESETEKAEDGAKYLVLSTAHLTDRCA
jgi:hypothetical protein